MKKLLLLSMLAVAPVALGQVDSGDSQRNIRGLGFFEGVNRSEILDDVDGTPSRTGKELVLKYHMPAELDDDDTTGDSGEEGALSLLWMREPVPVAGATGTPVILDFKEEETEHREIPGLFK